MFSATEAFAGLGHYFVVVVIVAVVFVAVYENRMSNVTAIL